ncbi:MarR family transcriptional regulator [Limnohabitans sp.]|uniref:MarR family winged helix-turn-helix transcriptional regulator n=1 Tax=Limnohabitans sp. TaxID=1907725 RepID=UPI00286EF180|nr:MarR family transcriptional regulator [Limnohabitans sp.]
MSPATRKVSNARKAKQEVLDVSNETDSTKYLETLLGYNASRASHTLVSHFMRSVSTFNLRTVDFSVLSVIGHWPGVTSRQLCNQLNVLPPNMVVLLRDLDKRELIKRQPHPTDGRATGLILSNRGKSLMKKAEKAASAADLQGSKYLSADERKVLIFLLKKIYVTQR